MMIGMAVGYETSSPSAGHKLYYFYNTTLTQQKLFSIFLNAVLLRLVPSVLLEECWDRRWNPL
jgi:hypothetical protein